MPGRCPRSQEEEAFQWIVAFDREDPIDGAVVGSFLVAVHNELACVLRPYLGEKPLIYVGED